MAIEPKRGCGYRKVGGLYLISGPMTHGCDRLPYELHVCSACGQGIKQTRGFTWIEPYKLLEGDHVLVSAQMSIANASNLQTQATGCNCPLVCPVCSPSIHFRDGKKAGLLWIGEKFYPTVHDFRQEATEQGISRRIKAIPRGFKIGETWILLAHPKGMNKPKVVEGDYKQSDPDTIESIYEEVHAIFMAFRPTKFERIVKQSEFDIWQKLSRPEPDDYTELDIKIYERLQKDVDNGVTLIPVPDNDPDHN